MTATIFTRPDAWAGGAYELAIELGPRDDSRLRAALRALWSHPDLDGVYALEDVEPRDQVRLEPGDSDLERPLRGVARVTGRPPIACETIVMRLDEGVDWVSLCLPLGSMASILDVGAFPFEDGSDLAWRALIDDWLRGLALLVFDAIEFRLALIGFDGGDGDDARRFHEGGVPEERRVGYLVPDAETLRWFPSNQGAPFDLA